MKNLTKVLLTICLLSSVKNTHAATPKEDLKYAQQLIETVNQSKSLSHNESEILRIALKKLSYVENALNASEDDTSLNTDQKLENCSQVAAQQRYDNVRDMALRACIDRFAATSSLQACNRVVEQMRYYNYQSIARTKCLAVAKP